jgi:predicted  nucleic acid-binding Zn-ribbon protein
MKDPQHAATKADLNSLEARINENFAAINNNFQTFAEQIIETVDSFRDEFRSEILTIKNDIQEIKERLTDLEKRTIEDSNALGNTIVKMRKEIKSLDRRLKKIETQQV